MVRRTSPIPSSYSLAPGNVKAELRLVLRSVRAASEGERRGLATFKEG